jgi:hypothetical protein
LRCGTTGEPLIRYMARSTSRSCSPTTSFQKTTIVATMMSGGRTTVRRLAIFAVRVMG